MKRYLVIILGLILVECATTDKMREISKANYPADFFNSLSEDINHTNLDVNSDEFTIELERITHKNFETNLSFKEDSYFSTKQFGIDYLNFLLLRHSDLLLALFEIQVNFGLNLNLGQIIINDKFFKEVIKGMKELYPIEFKLIQKNLIKMSYKNPYHDQLNDLFEKWNSDDVLVSSNPIDIKSGDFIIEGIKADEYSFTRYSGFQNEFSNYSLDTNKIYILWISDFEYHLSFLDFNKHSILESELYKCRITEITDSSYHCLTKSIDGIKLYNLIKVK